MPPLKAQTTNSYLHPITDFRRSGRTVKDADGRMTTEVRRLLSLDERKKDRDGFASFTRNGISYCIKTAPEQRGTSRKNRYAMAS